MQCVHLQQVSLRLRLLLKMILIHDKIYDCS